MTKGIESWPQTVFFTARLIELQTKKQTKGTRGLPQSSISLQLNGVDLGYFKL